MTCDLSIAQEGRITFRSGESFWCPMVTQDDDGDFSVRLEHGWYAQYAQNGINLCSGIIIDKDGNVKEHIKNHNRDIILFEDIPHNGEPTSVTP